MKRACQIGVLTFSLFFASAVQAGVILPQLNPVAIDTTISFNSIWQASIKFINYLSVDVDLFWIDFSGARELYATIPANSSYYQETYLTHPWLIVEEGTEPLVAGPSPTGFFGITGTGTLIAGFLPQTTDPGWANLTISPDIAIIGSPTPLPAALPLFLSGLGVMGLLGRYRKRKKAVGMPPGWRCIRSPNVRSP